MKIVFCIDSMNKGGAERVVSNLSNYLANNYEISIIATRDANPQYILNKNIRYYKVDQQISKNSIFFKNYKRIKKIKNILKQEKPDIILSFLPNTTYRLMIANLKLKFKTIISVRNDPNVEYNNIFKKMLVKLLYTRANGFVFQTKEAKDWFPKGIRDKSVIIPNPINEDFIRKPYDLEREKVIVNVGRLYKQKNHELLIKAFSNVLKKHNDYKLKIIGDGELKDNLEKMIKDLGIKENVILMGTTDNVIDNIYKSSMFVLSSNYEGMPNALMEAMALGIPCISTDCPIGGPRFLIKNKENGILVKVNDIEEMEKAINYIIENNQEAHKMGQKASEIRNELNPQIINKKWEEYVLKIINNS